MPNDAPHLQANAMKARMAAGGLAVGMIVRLTRSVEIAAIGKSAGFRLSVHRPGA